MDNPLRAALKAFDAAARGAFEIIAAFWRLMQQAVFHHGTGHEVALATAATAPSSFVARGLQKGSKDASCLNGEHLNLSARIRIETEGARRTGHRLHERRRGNGPEGRRGRFPFCVQGLLLNGIGLDSG